MLVAKCHTTSIYCIRIVPTPRSGRRNAERSAVEQMIVSAFGPDARLSHRPDGSPFVVGADSNISISHGAGLALLAVDPVRAVGIDIESRRPSLAAVAPRVLNSEEMLAYGATLQGLLRAWTAKEAIFKAAGVKGLTLPEIRLPGSVAGRRFDVEFLERNEFTIALAYESPCESRKV